MPISTPAVSTNSVGVDDSDIVARPSTYRIVPTSSTRPEPKRSAIMPAKGWAAPHVRFCTAMASAKISRPQPISSETGCRNSPKPLRMPIET